MIFSLHTLICLFDFIATVIVVLIVLLIFQSKSKNKRIKNTSSDGELHV
jgi:hypothetical protein